MSVVVRLPISLCSLDVPEVTQPVYMHSGLQFQFYFWFPYTSYRVKRFFSVVLFDFGIVGVHPGFPLCVCVPGQGNSYHKRWMNGLGTRSDFSHTTLKVVLVVHGNVGPHYRSSVTSSLEVMHSFGVEWSGWLLSKFSVLTDFPLPGCSTAEIRTGEGRYSCVFCRFFQISGSSDNLSKINEEEENFIIALSLDLCIPS